jgi:hypothetical protein
MKYWQIKKPEEIEQVFLPPQVVNQFGQDRKDQIAKVWQENANKPTISLEEVG